MQQFYQLTISIHGHFIIIPGVAISNLGDNLNNFVKALKIYQI